MFRFLAELFEICWLLKGLRPGKLINVPVSPHCIIFRSLFPVDAGCPLTDTDSPTANEGEQLLEDSLNGISDESFALEDEPSESSLTGSAYAEVRSAAN